MSTCRTTRTAIRRRSISCRSRVDEAMKFIQVPAEFTLELFATEPDIVKPIAFAFDERGRMWIAETMDYPNEPLQRQARRRSHPDPRGHQRRRHAPTSSRSSPTSSNIPTSLVFANGGVIVAQPPHILFLKDTNGDDKADVRKVLSTGWGISATRTRPVEPAVRAGQLHLGRRRLLGLQRRDQRQAVRSSRQAAFRFKPDGSDFEVMTGSTNNTWGLGFTETFDVFGSTANNDPSWYMAIPNRYFDGIEGLPTPGQRGVGLRLSERRGVLRRASADAVHPPGGRVQRLHRGRRSLSLHRARVPEGVLEPHRVHQRADGAPDRPGHHREAGRRASSRATAGTSPPAPKSGSRRSTRRSDRTARCGSPTGTTSSSSTTRRRRASATAAATPTSRRCAIISAAASTASPTRARRRRRSDRCRRTTPRGCSSALGVRQHALAAARRSGCSSSAARRTSSRSCIALVQNTSVDAVGINGGAMHALWTLKGLGELDVADERRRTRPRSPR